MDDEVKKELDKMTLQELISVEPTARDSEDHKDWLQAVLERLGLGEVGTKLVILEGLVHKLLLVHYHEDGKVKFGEIPSEEDKKTDPC